MFTIIIMALAVGGGFFGKCSYDETVRLKSKLNVANKVYKEALTSLKKEHQDNMTLLKGELEREKVDCKKRMARQKRRCDATKEHDSMLKSYKISARECQEKLRAMALEIVKKEQQTLK